MEPYEKAYEDVEHQHEKRRQPIKRGTVLDVYLFCWELVLWICIIFNANPDTDPDLQYLMTNYCKFTAEKMIFLKNEKLLFFSALGFH